MSSCIGSFCYNSWLFLLKNSLRIHKTKFSNLSIAMSTSKKDIFDEPTCQLAGLYISSSYETMASQVLFVAFLGKLSHMILRRIYMPRLLSDMLVAIIIFKFGLIRDVFEDRRSLLFERFGNFIFSIYFFALGLEMDPFSVFDPPGNDGYIAYVGMLSTLVITACFQKVLVNNKVGLLAENTVRANLAFGLALATTGSPSLTRLTTELKLSKTVVGQTAIRAGIFSDMIATSLMCIGNLIFHDDFTLSESEQR